MLQRVCIEKNVNRHFSLNFVIKRTDLNALLFFYSHLAFQRDPKPFKRFMAFRVSSSKKSKSYISDSEVTPARSEKKTLKACQLPHFLHRTIVQG